MKADILTMHKVILILSVIRAIYALEAPIIGVLSQETYIVDKYFPNEEHASYIAASYVKYLESSGARVVPIWIGQDKEYYERAVNYTNGMLFPGGGTYFDEPAGYAEAAKAIYKLAVDINEKGVYYPIWGTCLGMQVIVFADVDEVDVRVNCSLKNKAIPLEFVKDFEESKLFSNAPKDVVDILKSSNVTFNYHQFCVTKEKLEELGVSDNWTILTTNKDIDDFEFVSAFESKSYPFYGIQFHPEKNLYEFENKNIPHSIEAVKISQYFANFFVQQCRKNSNSFPDIEIQKKSLIYNYIPRYIHGSYEQVYVFDKEDFENSQLL